MRIKSLIKLPLLAASFISVSVLANSFKLSSSDISHGKAMGSAQEYKGFGCDGGNVSPQLSWQGAPEGTKAFAVMGHDPDAPTGSGWWHWQLINIPKNVTELAAGAGNPNKDGSPEGSTSGRNDYGEAGFGGACPPEGNGVHRYRFTVHALSQKLEVPDNASAALIGYLVNAHSLGSDTIEALYERK